MHVKMYVWTYRKGLQELHSAVQVHVALNDVYFANAVNSLHLAKWTIF